MVHFQAEWIRHLHDLFNEWLPEELAHKSIHIWLCYAINVKTFIDDRLVDILLRFPHYFL